MPKYSPFTLSMQITRMFEQGQSMFATLKVQDWLKERNEDPTNYKITFNQRPAPPGSSLVMIVDIGLERKDGQPVDEWLQLEVNRHSD
jgi:hypothetical protein